MDSLYEELSKIINQGDEKAAREFILKNLGKFPQATQDAIITQLFEEALTVTEKSTASVMNFQKEALSAAKAIEDAREKLEKQAKLAEIKESL